MGFLKRSDNGPSLFERPVILAEIIFAAVMLVFSPCLKANLSNWDDQVHIYLNPQVDTLSFDTLGQMFRQRINGIYVPLTTLTFAVEKHFFGYDPGLIHLNNMLLHATVAVLVMWLGFSLGLSGRASFLAALLFALHPIHVESVAWATERKDVLYSSFYMAAVLLWWRWLGNRRSLELVLAFLAAALSLLAKPMAVSLPLVLALLAWYRNGLKGFPWLRVALFAALAAAVGGVTYSGFVRNPVADTGHAPLIWMWTAMFPLWKFFFPAVLHPIYDLPAPVMFWHWPYWSSFVLAAGLAWALWKNRRDRLLMLAAGWYFLSTFFLYRFDALDTHIVADRFMYLPSVGLCLWLGGRFHRWLGREKRRLAAALLATIFTLLSLKTYAQCWIWYDGNTLWSYVIANHPRREFAYNNRAIIYVTEGRFDLAERDITQAILLADNPPRVFYNRGMIRQMWAEALSREGQAEEARGLYRLAIPDFSESIKGAPDFPKSWNYRGLVKYKLGDHAGALQDLGRALELDAGYVKALNNRSKVWLELKEYEKAAEDNRQALRYHPSFPQAYNDLGIALYMLGRDREAVESLTRALELDPRLYEAWYNRSVLRERLGDREGAARDMEQAQAVKATVPSGEKLDF